MFIGWVQQASANLENLFILALCCWYKIF